MGKKNNHQSHVIEGIITAARGKYRLSDDGVHGPAHWQRVRENGIRLAPLTGANILLVEMFAFLHDCCREDDNVDPDHGPRAAEYIESLRSDWLKGLSKMDFGILQEAIRDHSFGRESGDPTIATCWDADRLDIGRVGGMPNKKYLLTDAAKDPNIIRWAYKRSIG